jgi:hypothetical protein
VSRSAPWTILLGLFLSAVAQGEEIPLHGFAQVNYAMRMAADLPAGWPARQRDFLLGDERVQLEYAHTSATSGFSTRLDLFHDAVEGRARLDLREGYLDLSLGKFVLRAGRQLLTWGTGDLVFVNDVFPKDWVALLSGAPVEYLKLGVDALNLSFHPGPFAFQVVLIPFFAPDRTPTPDLLVFYSPLPPGTPAETVRPSPQRKNLEAAFRLYGTYGGYDLALYAYRGFFRSPGARFDPAAGKATFFYPELGVYGASLQGALLNGLLALESGFCDSRQDRDGTDPAIENPHLRFLAGYQRAFGADFTLGLQYYGERIRHYGAYQQALPPGFTVRDQTRSYFTVRLTQLLKYQTLRLSLFAFYSPTEEDYYLIPEVRYSFSDELWGAIGGNLLGGKRGTSFFGQFDQNDNLYLTLRYGF